LPKGLPKEEPEIENPENLWKIINGRIEASPTTKDKTIKDLPQNKL
tara:strand:+ start:2814 stop:2951 length:138 start_codon:yes stop_codon:yes gene_type:complete